MMSSATKMTTMSMTTPRCDVRTTSVARIRVAIHREFGLIAAVHTRAHLQSDNAVGRRDTHQEFADVARGYVRRRDQERCRHSPGRVSSLELRHTVQNI